MDESPWKPIKYEDTIRKAKMAVDDSGFRYQQHEKTSPGWPCKEIRSVMKCPLIPKNTTVWNLILQFKNEENAAKLTHVQAMRGNLDDIHVQRKEKTKKKHSRLHSLCSNYSEMSSMDFLECIANVLHS